MIFGGVIVGIVLMAIMIYLAVDKKSNTATRYAALIALGVMILAVIICLFIIFTDKTVPVDPSVLIVGEPPAEREEKGSNFWILLLLIGFLLAIFVMIFIFAMKENKKHKGEGPDNFKPISNW